MKHIDLLLKIEEKTRQENSGHVYFRRTGANTIVISCRGYKHMDLYDALEKLLKLGCKYDFSKGEIEQWDKISGRTYIHLLEPKESQNETT